jgi:hypothetical protein
VVHKDVVMQRSPGFVALLGSALAAVGTVASASSGAIPAHTRVELRLDTPVDTRRTRTGDALAFTLTGSDCIDGRRLVVGAVVAGRVVHAQKSGMFGKAAELLISAGPWAPEGGNAVVRFRNLHAQSGRSRDATALGVSIVAGPFAAFVRGGHIVMPAGTPMVAETRDIHELPAGAFESCAEIPSSTETQPSPIDPPVHTEPLQGELHEANDVRPADPRREPEPDSRDGPGAAGH